MKTPMKELITMAKVRCDISMSLDGFVAGPNPSLEEPLGAGGELLHEWAFAAASWRESHGLSGGETNADSEVLQESIDSTGAVVMGRRMFSGGEGAWEPDPRAEGWWGDEPPFHVPVFVLTHHARETLVMKGGTSFNFVTDGIGTALEQARAAAGDKDVLLAGGANIVQQYLEAGLLDELQIHVAPVLLGDGTSLFDRLRIEPLGLEATRMIASPSVTHRRFRVPARTT
ncbi:MAG TPA: dihydrofolate reductase family protein [Gaiellaceae bacterium]